MNKIYLFLFFLCFGFTYSQQLNCKVTINSQVLANTNQQVYKTLETAITDFMNNTDWSGRTLKQEEKINCSVYINLTSQDNNQFSGTMQVQSSRLIYDSSYLSPVFNFNDKDVSFTYTEFQNLLYNPNTFENNLVSLLAYYSYVILGINADTFLPESGNRFFELAQNICNVAQQGGYKGWSQADGLQNRYFLVSDLLSPTYVELRNTELNYHKGLDLMTTNQKQAKEVIKDALMNITKLASVKPNAFLTRTFFDAKSDEIRSIFTGGPSVPIADLVETLNRISPLNSSKWNELTF